MRISDDTIDAFRLEGYKELEEIAMDGIGHLRYKIWQDSYGRLAEYREIWVNEGKRRRGFGKKLMGKLYKLARIMDIKEVYVRASTNGKDDALGKFITACGFKPIYKVAKEFGPNTISWLGMPIVLKEKEKYRFKVFGFTFKKVLR